MRSKMHHLLQEVQTLSVAEQREFLQKLTAQVGLLEMPDKEMQAFWKAKSLEELQAEQGTKPIQSLAQLSSQAWPQDEEIEDFLADLQMQRQEDRNTVP